MSFWDSTDLLPGLLPAMFRGVSFHVPDTSLEAGRRIIVTLFPGLDAAAFDDLGRHDGPISISGIMIGDDYVAQALALQAAFQKPGPGTLMHPWLGEMSVVIADPGQIRFSSHALRLVQFDVSFLRVDILSGLIGSTLAGLLSSVTALFAIPSRIVSAVLGTAVMAVATWSGVVGMSTSIAGLASAAVAGSSAAPALIAATEGPLATLDTAIGGAPGLTSSVQIASSIGAVMSAIATVAIGADVPAIGSGSSAAVAVSTFEARAGAGLLLDLSAEIHAQPATGSYDAAMRLAAEVAALAQAVRTSAEIDFESRQDAAAWRERIASAIERAIGGAADLAPMAPASAALAIDRLSATSAALGQDMNEIIGRLPSVYRITPASTVSTWLIAQHLAGDDPTTVVAMFDDIVRRNKLRHPAIVSPDGVEVLT